jgi:hypothetical protein
VKSKINLTLETKIVVSAVLYFSKRSLVLEG